MKTVENKFNSVCIIIEKIRHGALTLIDANDQGKIDKMLCLTWKVFDCII